MRKLPSALVAAFLLVSCGGGGSGLDQLQAGAKNGKGNCPSCIPAPPPPPPPPPAPAPSPAPAPAPAPAPGTAMAPLGVNIEGLADWQRLPMFVDAVKTARHWGSFAAPWDETAPVDAQGWPTGDAGMVVTMQTSDPGEATRTLQPGVWRLSWVGKGTPVMNASPDITLSNIVFDATANKGTADVNVGPNAYQMIMAFSGTAGGVKNVKIIRPGYADTDTFTSEFKQALAPFGTVRFMDYLGTNGNPSKTWAERTTPASASQAGAKGGSYEYAIQVANELGKDIWLNVPVAADDDYVRQLATLLNTTLAPGRIAYIEYTNEGWNWVFPQSNTNMAMAVDEILAGDKSLADGMPSTCTRTQFEANSDGCNKYWAALYRLGKRGAQISTMFSQVMGASALNTRFRPIMATQWAYLAIGEQQLKWVNKWVGAPKNYFYAIAGAPYFGLQSQDTAWTLANNPSLTVDQLLQYMQESVTGYYPWFQPNMVYAGQDWSNASQKSLANFYGIKSVAYEGGQDLLQTDVNLVAKIQATKDPRFAAIHQNYLGQWFGCGNDLFMYYGLSSAWARWGFWGLTNSPNDLTGPKYTSAAQIAQTPAANFTTCR